MNRKIFDFVTFWNLYFFCCFGYLNIYTNLVCHIKGKDEIGILELLLIPGVGAIFITLSLLVINVVIEKVKMVFFKLKSEDIKLLTKQYGNLKIWSVMLFICTMLMAYITYYNIINWPSTFVVRWWPMLGVLGVLGFIIPLVMSISAILKLKKLLKKPALYL